MLRPSIGEIEKCSISLSVKTEICNTLLLLYKSRNTNDTRFLSEYFLKDVETGWPDTSSYGKNICASPTNFVGSNNENSRKRIRKYYRFWKKIEKRFTHLETHEILPPNASEGVLSETLLNCASGQKYFSFFVSILSYFASNLLPSKDMT